MESNNVEKTGILLVSHGSRLPESTKTINNLADIYRKQTTFKVGVAYMELREPNIPQAINDLVKNSEIEKIIVVPVFLSHGMHTTRDIPKILGIKTKDDNNNDKGNHSHHNHESHSHHKHDNHNHHNHEHQHDHSHDFEKVDFDGEIIYTEPLGADPLIAEIIKNRVDSAIEQG